MIKFLNEELVDLHPRDIGEKIANLPESKQTMSFMTLPGKLKADVFTYLQRDIKEMILSSLGSREIADILESMPPDDRTAVFEDFPDMMIKDVVNYLSAEERRIALELIGYEPDTVGRIMTPYYVQAYPEWTVKRTLQHIKKNGQKAETLNYIYVVDEEQRLIDDIRIGAILMAEEDDLIGEIADKESVQLLSTQHFEEAIDIFQKYDRSALPVVTNAGVLVGIVTADDILDQIEKRDTEDIQKIGGSTALDMPYKSTGVFTMIQKRAGWLVILFFGEMLTASAMGYFDEEISKAVVLALFVPLIISSGGNSGSQAATLIIRALALGEIKLRDWWYIFRREMLSGVMLGLILAVIGFLRIFIWQSTGLYDYGEYWGYIALTIGMSLVLIVLWGTIMGAMIPIILKKLKLDPATSSAPFVATFVDVTGLIIYFSVALLILSGKLL
ncbi:MAG: magnesium transporter [Porphyromonadaceae bacterium]|jgi:magnesium transporter|nr:magnesium transporter [Porphyromonadaceae bacterium]